MSFGENPYGQNYATGGGAAGGGGFMAGSQGDSPSGKGASARNTLRPVTIAQIRSAQQSHADADFKIDGVDVGQLTFVAVVRNISRNATNVSFNVEDGTGSIDVRQWLDSNSDDTGKASEIASNQYVRVLGTIKSFQGKKSISSGHMRVVPDYNEVLFHKLEAVWVHLQLTGAGGAGAGATMNANTNVDMDSNGGGGDFSAITSPVQRKIAQAISMLAGPDSEGITAKEVHGKLPSMALATIAKEIDEMVNNGFLYHSVDDEHVLLP